MVGCVSCGYRHCNWKGKKHLVHRLIYQLVTGIILLPSEVIDHEDGNTLNNKFSNLRVTDSLGNSKNQKMHSSNKSGVTGVSWDKSRNKWRAWIGKRNLGRFDSFEEAIIIRREAEVEEGYHKNHGKR